MHVFFIMPLPSQPRYLKRIDNFRRLGISYTIFSFERDYFKGKKDTLEYISLGKVEHGNYIKRIFSLFKAFLLIKREMINKIPNVLYAFNVDIAFIAVLLKIYCKCECQVVYECGDIQPLMLKSKLARLLERWVINRCRIVVTTSEGFISNYFKKIQNVNMEKLFLIENKLNEPLKKHIYKELSNGKITIGYFGLLSYTNTWELLLKLVNMFPEKFNIYVRGYPGGISSTVLKKYISNSNIIYDGPYIQPDDLPDMHSKIDLIWSAYVDYDQYKNYNLKWAMRNQFYESCFFNTPMIVQEGTQPEKYVKEYDLGLVIDMLNIEKTLEKMQNITVEDIKRWRHNFKKISEEFSIYTNEHEKLAKLLNLL